MCQQHVRAFCVLEVYFTPVLCEHLVCVCTATEVAATVGHPGIDYVDDDLHVPLGVWVVVYTMHGADVPAAVAHPIATKLMSQLREVRSRRGVCSAMSSIRLVA